MEILGRLIVDKQDILNTITVLEAVKSRRLKKAHVRKFRTPDLFGWSLSISSVIEIQGREEELLNVLAIRFANYIIGDKDNSLFFYPEVELMIEEGKKEIKDEDDLYVSSGSLMLFRRNGGYIMSDGLVLSPLRDREVKLVGYAMKNGWYIQTENFKITPQMSTYRTIPIKDIWKFYTLMLLEG